MYLLVYNVIALPLLGIDLLIRLAKGKSRQGWGERWGHLPPALRYKKGRRVWVHCASVGEVTAATPILQEYRKRRPDDEVIMTVITPGGHEIASGMTGKAIDRVFYAPFDVPIAVKRAMRSIQPDLYVGLETELWPNLLHYARTFESKLILVNGRLSDKSFPRYLKLKSLFSGVLANFHRILTQTATDADRFRNIGAPPSRVSAVGNAKFDGTVERLTHAEIESLRGDLHLSPEQSVLVVGSTRTAEEERIIYKAYNEARKSRPNLALIHAPRHIDRAAEVETLMRESGLNPVRRSQLDSSKGEVEHLILDTFGELAKVYALADVAFIGNSMTAPGGGQNLLQPLAQGVPVLYGPYMQNFRDLCAMAESAGVAMKVTADHLPDAINSAIQSDHKMEHAALALIDSNRGASARYADEMVALMESQS